jgi:hypothetical protein
MKRTLLVITTVATLVSVGLIWSSSRSEPVALDATDTINITAILSACGQSAECLRAALSTSVLANPAIVTSQIATYYQTPRPSSMSCHTALHTAGQLLATKYDASSVPEVGLNWSACSLGLLHGLVESQTYVVDPADAGSAAYASCINSSFHDDRTVFDACLHALGHSLYDSFPNEPLANAEAACELGASSYGGLKVIGDCLNGVYMQDRNERFPGISWTNYDGSVAASVQLKHCANAAQPLSCAVLYSEPVLAKENGTVGEAVTEFFNWCSPFEAQLGDPWPACAHGLGWSVAVVLKDAPAELNLCERLPQPAGNAEYCLAGMLGSRLMTGTPEKRARTEICAALEARSCNMVRSIAELRSGINNTASTGGQ